MSTNPDERERAPEALVAAADRTPLAEVGYRDPGGTWQAEVLVPLVAGGRLTFALPFAQRDVARRLADAGEALLVCSDARLALGGWRATAGRVALALEVDAEGDRFAAALLDRELRKHPPARLLADSPMLRREHWWYLPRLLLHAAPARAWAVAARTDPREGVLFTGSGEAPAETVAVEDGGAGALRLTSLAGTPLPAAADACLLRHDAALPDLEQRSRRVDRGRLAPDGTFTPVDGEGALALPPPARLAARYRAARAFERACRRGLRAWAGEDRRA